MAHQSMRTSLRQLIQFNRCCVLSRSYGKGCQRSVSCPPFGSRCISTTPSIRNNGRILGRSTILLQDGLDINEMPIVVRRMGPNDILFKNELYGGVEIASVSAKDEEFKQKLLRCETVRGVFKLLDVGDEDVTPYSAAFALQRLCLIQKGSQADIDSFISRAILNELCETTTRGIQSLENETLLTLLRCYCLSGRDSYPQKFVTDVNNEVERRIGEHAFKVEELCKLLEIVSNCTHVDTEMVNNLWIHLGNRYSEIDEKNIAQVYGLGKYMSEEQKLLYPLIDRCFSKCWWQLNVRDAVSICQSVTHCNHANHRQMTKLAQWIYVNLHDVTMDDMLHFITMYSHFSFSDSNFVKALERFFVAKHKQFDVTLFAMGMEYCRKIRCQSPKIFDLSAAHFEKNSALYGQMETLFVLRPLGQLNYVPHNATHLFAQIEKEMDKWFEKMEPHLLLELLVSFVYINRIPRNFLHEIFSPRFFDKLRSSPFWSSEYGRKRSANWIWTLVVSLRADEQYFRSLFLDPTVLKHKTKERRVHTSSVLTTGVQALGINHYQYRRGVDMSGFLFGYFVDLLIHVNEEGHIVPPSIKLPDGNNKKRITILLAGPNDYCSNSKHYTGAFAAKKRHLEGHDFIVLVFDAESVTKHVGDTIRLIRYELAKHISFSRGKACTANFERHHLKYKDFEDFTKSGRKYNTQKLLFGALIEDEKKGSSMVQKPSPWPEEESEEWYLRDSDDNDENL